MKNSTKIIGLIRFSLLTSNPQSTWERARVSGTEEAFRDHLLSPDRLGHRFALFEGITLPSLDAQTDPNFQVVVMTSEQLPQTFRNRLEALSSERHYLRIRYYDESQTVARCASDSVKIYQGDCKRNITFRIDDDDALSKHYISQLIEAAEGLADGHVITFPEGLYVRSTSKNELEVASVDYPRIALGLARIGSQDGDSIFKIGNHARKSDIPVKEVRTSSPSWIRSVYCSSDSAAARDAFGSHVKTGTNHIRAAQDFSDQFSEIFPLLSFGRMTAALSDSDEGADED